MDKGMKGLLTGDLTVKLLYDIQQSISKYNHKSKKLSVRMGDLILK